jgi:glucokinase
VERLRRDRDVTAVGVGAGGFIDERGATIVFAKNIGWVNEPLQEEMEAATGLPVILENDANAAAWAEWRFGAGRGENCLICLTIGTGIGGGIVIDGRVHRGRFGMGAELGHLLVVPDGIPCGCGAYGCWEMYCSGPALIEEARRQAVLPGDITGDAITAAARAGDPDAVELLRRIGWWLGRGMASLAAILDPGSFVIGGGVAEAGDLILAPARESFRHHLPAAKHRGEGRIARIVPAALGADAGLIGAADLARGAVRVVSGASYA